VDSVDATSLAAAGKSAKAVHTPVSRADDREQQCITQEVCCDWRMHINGLSLAEYCCIAALGLQQQLCYTTGEQSCQAVDASSILPVS
jgi:hypothetical protein